MTYRSPRSLNLRDLFSYDRKVFPVASLTDRILAQLFSFTCNIAESVGTFLCKGADLICRKLIKIFEFEASPVV